MRIVIFFMFFALVGCKSGNTLKSANNNEGILFVPQYTPGSQALIYKTRNDYSNLVPVLLSDDKTSIVSYPAPDDLKADNAYLLPAFLNKGYLLDNKGIGRNVAFLKLTYQEYSTLKKVPELNELYSNIIDKDPLTELCDCGNRTVFTDIKKQINNIIDKHKLRTVCRTIK